MDCGFMTINIETQIDEINIDRDSFGHLFISLSQRRGGGTQTLDFMIVRRMFYHFVNIAWIVILLPMLKDLGLYSQNFFSVQLMKGPSRQE